MKVWDAKPEEAKVRKFDQVSRLQLFLYHIWKRCESGRDLDNFYTISMSDSKEMQQGYGYIWASILFICQNGYENWQGQVLCIQIKAG